MTVQLLALAALATVSLSLFFPINMAIGKSRHPSRLQNHHSAIPFIPAFIVPYLGFFPYVAVSMLVVLLFTPVAARLYTSLIFSGVIAALIWYFMPTMMEDRPRLSARGIFSKTIAWMYRMDPGGNAFPSAHASTAVLCSYYLTYIFPLHETAIWACGATIVSSTLFVKQHHLRDLIGGIALALAAIGFSYFILGGLY